MAGYLLDTSTLIALMNGGSNFHQPSTDLLKALAVEDLTFVSPISLGELRSGVESVFAIKGQRPLTAAKTLERAESYDLLTVDRHVAQAYASARRAHLEDWIDNVTGARLNGTAGGDDPVTSVPDTTRTGECDFQ